MAAYLITNAAIDAVIHPYWLNTASQYEALFYMCNFQTWPSDFMSTRCMINATARHL